MSQKKKNQQSKQSDLAIAKLALLAGALEVAGAIINLLDHRQDDSISAGRRKGGGSLPTFIFIVSGSEVKRNGKAENGS